MMRFDFFFLPISV